MRCDELQAEVDSAQKEARNYSTEVSQIAVYHLPRPQASLFLFSTARCAWCCGTVVVFPWIPAPLYSRSFFKMAPGDKADPARDCYKFQSKT